MARTIALIQTAAPAHLLADMARKLIVLGCAVTLIMAGRPLPL